MACVGSSVIQFVNEFDYSLDSSVDTFVPAEVVGHSAAASGGNQRSGPWLANP